MSEPQGYIVKNPVGSGKTRAVLKHILYGTKNNIRYINSKLKRTIILVPSDRIKKAWLRELLILLYEKKVSNYKSLLKKAMTEETDKKSSIYNFGIDTILDYLGKGEISHPLILSYRDKSLLKDRNPLHRRGRAAKCHCHYLVLDEWHSVPNLLRKECKKYSENENYNGWLLGGRNVEKAVYFVSATPINPVKEQRNVEDISHDIYDSKSFRDVMSEAKVEAIELIQCFIGRRIDNESHKLKGDLEQLQFAKALRLLDVEDIPQKYFNRESAQWKYPREAKEGTDNVDRTNELLAINNFIESDDYGWKDEYAYCAGLIRTTYNLKKRKHIISTSKKAKSCFGFKYETLYASASGKNPIAAKWLLKKHTRVQRLLAALEQHGVLECDRDNWEITLKKKKALIFCVHQGVALGLMRVLSSHIGGCENEKCKDRDHECKRTYGCSLYTNVINDSKGTLDKKLRDFNKRNSPPYILILTDALSEGIDLHRACNLMVHYEVPWSPLRLFQRIGRLTRLKQNKGKVSFNEVTVGHVIIPGSVEEERINRLIRRIKFLQKEQLWPKNDVRIVTIIKGLIGGGPSLHYKECNELLAMGRECC